ncbi:GntR family transcriptional regulator [Pseudarthrobacter sp. YAF2]|uniref:GntR family transcriptional regulator n=1 Tax=Pseudarthrobacter sp. YAF2 TaxID=3233078 RepID=UPI003F9E963B
MTSTAIRRTAAPLRQEVTDALRKAIVTNEYGAGERLVESVLCDRFSVSRTVVREALRQLESEGLVTTVPNRGPEVATLTLQEAEGLYEVRAALESLAGSLFATRAAGEDCARLVQALSNIRETIGGADISASLELKDAYYDVLLDGAGNQEIRRMLKLVNARTQVLRMYSLASPGREPKTVEELERITTAAAIRRDPAETREACEEHVRKAAAAAIGEMRRRLTA